MTDMIRQIKTEPPQGSVQTVKKDAFYSITV